MADVFSAEYKPWSYTARVPTVLRTTKLPLPAAASGISKQTDNFDAKYSRPMHDAAWWEKHMRGQDFSVEDNLDTVKFNRALWLGLEGPHIPFPTRTTGIDLSVDRGKLLAEFYANGKN
jgi:hypothetical protein